MAVAVLVGVPVAVVVWVDVWVAKHALHFAGQNLSTGRPFSSGRPHVSSLHSRGSSRSLHSTVAVVDAVVVAVVELVLVAVLVSVVAALLVTLPVAEVVGVDATLMDTVVVAVLVGVALAVDVAVTGAVSVAVVVAVDPAVCEGVVDAVVEAVDVWVDVAVGVQLEHRTGHDFRKKAPSRLHMVLSVPHVIGSLRPLHSGSIVLDTVVVEVVVVVVGQVSHRTGHWNFTASPNRSARLQYDDSVEHSGGSARFWHFSPAVTVVVAVEVAVVSSLQVLQSTGQPFRARSATKPVFRQSAASIVLQVAGSGWSLHRLHVWHSTRQFFRAET